MNIFALFGISICLILKFSQAQLFNALNTRPAEYDQSSEPTTIIHTENEPRFSESQGNDFVSVLLNQAQNIISKKKRNVSAQTIPQRTHSKYEGISDYVKNQQAPAAFERRIPQYNQFTAGKSFKRESDVERAYKEAVAFDPENLAIEKINTNYTHSRKLEVKNLVVNSNINFPSKNFSLKIGNSSLTSSEIQKVLLFNVKLLKKCGKHLEKCMTKTSDLSDLIEKSGINKKSKRVAEPRFLQKLADDDLNEYSSLDKELEDAAKVKEPVKSEDLALDSLEADISDSSLNI